MLSNLTNQFFTLLKRKNNASEQLEIEFGSQDQIDLISYGGLEETSNHLLIDDTYYRTLFISGYPFVASSGWLNSLINFNHNIDISYHIEPIDPLLALPKLTRKITELESTKRAMQKNGQIVGSEINDPLESAIELKNKIQRGQEKLFQISIYITLSADSLSELNKNTKLLESILSSKLFFTKVATFQQPEALQSILPRSDNQLNHKRNLDSSSAALTFPFVSSELVHESGILYGINKSNNSIVIVDRFALHNANSITFAQSGAGKSYTSKIEILRQLMQGTNVIIIDPEREYKQLADSVNGTYIKISTKSKEKINPFELPITNSTDNILSEHIQELTQIIGLMAEGLSSEEKAVVDKAILETYKKFGFSLKSTKRLSKPQEYPLFKDFCKTLKIMKEKKLLTRLEKYLSGSLSAVFDAPTNINLSNRLIVFDIKDLSDSIRPIMMLVIANFVYNQVKTKPNKRLLLIDEAWLLLQHDESASFIAGLTRRARKYYLGVSIITQQASDFLSNIHGKAIASQSALRILMRQDSTTIQQVTQEFNLSEYEQKFLLSCDRGEAIIIADQNHVAVKIVASDKEHPLITTNPVEKLSHN